MRDYEYLISIALRDKLKESIKEYSVRLNTIIYTYLFRQEN